MNRGLRIFLWILGIVAAVSVIGYLVVGVLDTLRMLEDSPRSSYGQTVPWGDDEDSDSSDTQSALPEQKKQTDPNSAGIVLQARPSGKEGSPHQIYQDVVSSVVGIKTQVGEEKLASQGSGIILTENGYIVTNAHVVGNSKTNSVRVILYGDEQEYPANVVGFDTTTDLAVLKIQKTGLKPATFGNSDQMLVGDWVLAIGSPGGVNFSSTLTGGYVSALNRKLQTNSSKNLTFIQTDAAINPGNSGGPLVNMYGQVIGINSNKIMATGYEGMGFAIPVTRAKTVLDALVREGYVSGRARLGVTVKDLPEDEAATSKLPAGVVILEVAEQSAFKSNMVKSGDIITELDGNKVASQGEIFDILEKHKPGDSVKVKIYSPVTSSSKEYTIQLIEGKQ